jgi:ABC-type multidrug transport system fused ATPase/permease subunit
MTSAAGRFAGAVPLTATPPARRLFDDVRRHFGRSLGLTAALMVAGALAEGLGLLTILPLLALATPGRPAPAWLLGLSAHADLFVILLGLFILIMVLRAGILLLRDHAVARLESDYDVSLRVRAAATLAARGWPFAAQVGQAGMQTLLANDVPRTNVAVHQGLGAATAGFMLVVQLAVAASLSLPMAGGALALLALGLPAMIALSRRGRSTAEQIIDSQEESSQAVFTFHAGLKAALAQERVGDFLGAYHATLDRLRGLYIGFSDDLARSRARHAVAAAVAAAGVIGVGHALHLDLARLVALLILFARMSGPRRRCSNPWSAFRLTPPRSRRLRGAWARWSTRRRPMRAKARRSSGKPSNVARSRFTAAPAAGLLRFRSPFIAVNGSPSSVHRAPARPPCSTSWRACSRPTRGSCWSTGIHSPPPGRRRGGAACPMSASRSRRSIRPCTRRWAAQGRSAAGKCCDWSGSTPSSAAHPRGWPCRSPIAAPGCRGVSGSGC